VNDSQLTCEWPTVSRAWQNSDIDGSFRRDTISAAIRPCWSVSKTVSVVLVLNVANTYTGCSDHQRRTWVGDLTHLRATSADTANPGCFGQWRPDLRDNISAPVRDQTGLRHADADGNNSFTGGLVARRQSRSSPRRQPAVNIANDGVVVLQSGRARASTREKKHDRLRHASPSWRRHLDGPGTNSFTVGTSVFDGLLVVNRNSLQGADFNNTSVVFESANPAGILRRR